MTAHEHDGFWQPEHWFGWLYKEGWKPVVQVGIPVSTIDKNKKETITQSIITVDKRGVYRTRVKEILSDAVLGAYDYHCSKMIAHSTCDCVGYIGSGYDGPEYVGPEHV